MLFQSCVLREMLPAMLEVVFSSKDTKKPLRKSGCVDVLASLLVLILDMCI